jgi:hypothetical protein
VIPVIVLNDVAHAVPMARALLAGGIRMLAVTLRTPQALACIEAIAQSLAENLPPPRFEAIGLRQRSLPFMDMIRQCLKDDEAITWGVCRAKTSSLRAVRIRPATAHGPRTNISSLRA